MSAVTPAKDGRAVPGQSDKQGTVNRSAAEEGGFNSHGHDKAISATSRETTSRSQSRSGLEATIKTPALGPNLRKKMSAPRKEKRKATTRITRSKVCVRLMYPCVNGLTTFSIFCRMYATMRRTMKKNFRLKLNPERSFVDMYAMNTFPSSWLELES